MTDAMTEYGKAFGEAISALHRLDELTRDEWGNKSAQAKAIRSVLVPAIANIDAFMRKAFQEASERTGTVYTPNQETEL